MGEAKGRAERRSNDRESGEKGRDGDGRRRVREGDKRGNEVKRRGRHTPHTSERRCGSSFRREMPSSLLVSMCVRHAFKGMVGVLRYVQLGQKYSNTLNVFSRVLQRSKVYKRVQTCRKRVLMALSYIFLFGLTTS